jgi:uncharacterized phiE125 gp8 family phage protein
MLTTSRATVVTPPASEPVTLAQARKQLELSPNDTAHDDQLSLLIQAAREQWEHDTDSALITQSLSVTLPYFSDAYVLLPKRPIQSIISVTYYNEADQQQTLSTSIYDLDKPNRLLRLKTLQTWPSTGTRWDAVTVTYVAGHASVAAVPAIAKQAMLLLIGNYFENRDMIGSAMSLGAYENLVSRFRRATYP